MFVLLLGVFILLSPYYLPTSNLQKNIFIIWNVGQGSWSSLITQEACFHFDMGGYKIKQNNIIKKCKKKKNILLLTHADSDHINLSYYFSAKSTNFCLYKKPREPIKRHNLKYFKYLRLCKKKELLLLQKHRIIEIPFFISKKNKLKKKVTKKSQSNFLSRIFLIQNLILIGGDSTKKAELLWQHNIPNPEKIKYFILNHHGSKNSNHITLIKILKNLTGAIASAKKSRYGHPHKAVIKRLKQRKISLLQTEVWGSLYIYLNH